jgi:hypothetical protein
VDHPLYEVDHLIPLCLGGADTLSNLWPQSLHGSGWNAIDKDRLEKCACKLACSGTVPQKVLADSISRNWMNAYIEFLPLCERKR